MNLVSPTDVTDPPHDWSWARKDAHSWRPATGEMRYVVRQTTPSGERVIGPLERDEANALMAKWNSEAKA